MTADPPHSPSAARTRHWGLAALIAALSMIGPFTIDTYLPAFGAIRLEFAVS